MLTNIVDSLLLVLQLTIPISLSLFTTKNVAFFDPLFEQVKKVDTNIENHFYLDDSGLTCGTEIFLNDHWLVPSNVF